MPKIKSNYREGELIISFSNETLIFLPKKKKNVGEMNVLKIGQRELDKIASELGVYEYVSWIAIQVEFFRVVL